MANLDYIYSPYYGVEPFDPTTVGAVLTGHNLVVTVWNVTDKTEEGVPEPGVLIQPASQNANLISQRRVGGGVQAMSSRCSAQMYFMTDPASKDPTLAETQMFVLNPPPELRQQWAQNVSFNGGDTLDPANYTVLQSLAGGYTWYVRAEEGQTEDQNMLLPDSALYQFGTLYDLGEYDGTGGSWLPLLRTSGADGQPPEFLRSVDGTRDCRNARSRQRRGVLRTAPHCYRLLLASSHHHLSAQCCPGIAFSMPYRVHVENPVSVSWASFIREPYAIKKRFVLASLAEFKARRVQPTSEKRAFGEFFIHRGRYNIDPALHQRKVNRYGLPVAATLDGE